MGAGAVRAEPGVVYAGPGPRMRVGAAGEVEDKMRRWGCESARVWARVAGHADWKRTLELPRISWGEGLAMGVPGDEAKRAARCWVRAQRALGWAGL